jgi:hypothetical protein
MGGLVPQVLFCSFSSVMVPGMGDVVPQPAFLLPDVVDDGTMVGAAPAAGCGAGAGQSPLLAAITLEDDMTWVPLVGLAERDLAALVVRFDALDDPCHSLNPFPHRPRTSASCAPLSPISAFAVGPGRYGSDTRSGLFEYRPLAQRPTAALLGLLLFWGQATLVCRVPEPHNDVRGLGAST